MDCYTGEAYVKSLSVTLMLANIVKFSMVEETVGLGEKPSCTVRLLKTLPTYSLAKVSNLGCRSER